MARRTGCSVSWVAAVRSSSPDDAPPGADSGSFAPRGILRNASLAKRQPGVGKQFAQARRCLGQRGARLRVLRASTVGRVLVQADANFQRAQMFGEE